MSSKTEGFYPSSRKVYVSGNSHSDIRVPFREITLTPTHVADGTVEENEPLRVYDTSGAWGDDSQSCDVESGIPPVRQDWILARGDVETYDGREIQPQDNGYLTKGHEQYARMRSESKGGLKNFPGLKRNRYGQRTATLLHRWRMRSVGS